MPLHNSFALLIAPVLTLLGYAREDVEEGTVFVRDYPGNDEGEHIKGIVFKVCLDRNDPDMLPGGRLAWLGEWAPYFHNPSAPDAAMDMDDNDDALSEASSEGGPELSNTSIEIAGGYGFSTQFVDGCDFYEFDLSCPGGSQFTGVVLTYDDYITLSFRFEFTEAERSADATFQQWLDSLEADF